LLPASPLLVAAGHKAKAKSLEKELRVDERASETRKRGARWLAMREKKV
jgi:hypothetical protein